MVRGRFAPSPSGRMHLGNVFSAMLAWLSAKSRGGAIVLRVEDLDPARSRREYVDAILDDLRWLGLDWDFRAEDQSRRGAAYAAALDRLDGMGLLYPCYCSRDQLHAASAPHASDGRSVYPGTCRSLRPEDRPVGRAPAWRLRVPDETVAFRDGHMGEYRENLLRECGDFIIRRSDGVYAYQLAVMVDDADMNVTQVVRGSDLLSSTPRQLYLYRLLGKPAPEFFHVPLLTDPDGRRLSKRDRDLDLEALRRDHAPEQLIGLLACAAGLRPGPQPVSAAELAPEFDWEQITKRRTVDIRSILEQT